MLVHAEEDRAVLNAIDHLEIRAGSNPAQVLQARVKHEVQLTGQQRRHTRRFRLDGRVDDLGHISLGIGPAPP